MTEYHKSMDVDGVTKPNFHMTVEDRAGIDREFNDLLTENTSTLSLDEWGGETYGGDKLYESVSHPTVLKTARSFESAGFRKLFRMSDNHSILLKSFDITYTLGYYSTDSQLDLKNNQMFLPEGHELYDGLLAWCINYVAVANDVKACIALTNRMVSRWDGQCSSIGQIQRLIPDVFSLLPNRYSRWVTDYSRKPRLPSELKYLEDTQEGRAELELLQNKLTQGKLAAATAGDERSSRHRRYRLPTAVVNSSLR